MRTGKMEKEGKNNNKHLDLLIHVYIIYLAIHKAHTNLKTLSQIEIEISVIDFFC